MKRIVSILLTLFMIISVIPVNAEYSVMVSDVQKDSEYENLSYMVESTELKALHLDKVTDGTYNINNLPKLYDNDTVTSVRFDSRETRYVTLTINFKEEITFNKIVIYDRGRNTSKFTFEVEKDGQWVPFYDWNRVGEAVKYCYFPAQTLSKMRMNVTDITSQGESSYFGMLLTEIEFYNVTAPEYHRLDGMLKAAEDFLKEAENSGKPYFEDRIAALKNEIQKGYEIKENEEAKPYEIENLVRSVEEKYFSASRYLNYPREEYEKVIYNWKNKLTATGEEWTEDQIEAYKTIDLRAKTIWKTMVKDDSTDMLWESVGTIDDLKAKNTANDMGTVTSNLQRMAVAATHKYSSLKGNPDLIADIEYGCDKFFKFYFGEGIDWFGTHVWQHIIGFHKSMGQTIVLLYDVLPYEKVKYYSEQLYSQLRPDYVLFSGTNSYDTGLGAALYGAVLGYDYLITNLQDKLCQDLIYKHNFGEGDGYYEDYSYIFHKSVPYAGAYGISGYNYFNVVFSLLKDTPFLSDTTEISKYISDISINSYIPRLVYDAMPLIFMGRSTTSNNQEVAAGSSTLAKMCETGYLLSEPYRTELLSKCKWIALNSKTNYWKQMTDNGYIWRVVNDNSIIPEKADEFSKTYRYESRILHKRDNFTAGISMYNKWLMRFETLNGQNSKGWLINSGAHWIWDKDYNHYTDGYMLTADMKRVPGVTAENKEMPKLDSLTSAIQNAENDFANGLTFNSMYTVAGFEPDNYDSDLKARKSYFFFDDELVMLGSNINLTDSENKVETTVDQRMLKHGDVDGISVNGENLNADTVDNKTFEGTSYIHLKGREEGSQFGYYFPDKSSVNIDKRTTTNLRKDVDWYTYKDESTQTETLGTIYFDHGTNPQNDGYKYVILPGKTEEETKAYSKNPDIEILAQTNSYHAVKETGLNVTGLVNFDNANASAGGITVDKKGISIFKLTDTTGEFIINDPTNSVGKVNVTLDTGATEISDKSKNVRIKAISPKVVLEVDLTNANAEGAFIKFKPKKVRNPVFPPVGSGSGGGGGGGGASGVVTDKEEPEIKDDAGKEEDANLDDTPIDTPAITHNFKDIGGHWAENEIALAVKNGLMKGRSEESFAPDEYITRAEAAVLITNLKCLELPEYRNSFADVNQTEWYAKYVGAVFKDKIMSGSDGYFRPLEKLTREEMFKLAVLSGELTQSAKDFEFNDADKISPWAIEYAKISVGSGIITGDNLKNLNPDGFLTRAEAAVIFNRLDKYLHKK